MSVFAELDLSTLNAGDSLTSLADWSGDADIKVYSEGVDKALGIDGSSSKWALHGATPPGPNYQIEVMLYRESVGGTKGILARAIDGNNAYFARINQSSTDGEVNVQLYRFFGGSYDPVGTATPTSRIPWPISAGDTRRLIFDIDSTGLAANQTRLRVYVPEYSTDPIYDYTDTHSGLMAAGKVGIRSYQGLNGSDTSSTATAMFWKSFEARDHRVYRVHTDGVSEPFPSLPAAAAKAKAEHLTPSLPILFTCAGGYDSSPVEFTGFATTAANNITITGAPGNKPGTDFDTDKYHIGGNDFVHSVGIKDGIHCLVDKLQVLGSNRTGYSGVAVTGHDNTSMTNCIIDMSHNPTGAGFSAGYHPDSPDTDLLYVNNIFKMSPTATTGAAFRPILATSNHAVVIANNTFIDGWEHISIGYTRPWLIHNNLCQGANSKCFATVNTSNCANNITSDDSGHANDQVNTTVEWVAGEGYTPKAESAADGQGYDNSTFYGADILAQDQASGAWDIGAVLCAIQAATSNFKVYFGGEFVDGTPMRRESNAWVECEIAVYQGGGWKQ